MYLGIVPARAGSKRIPGKNLAPLNGVPLIDYTLRAAGESRRLGAVVVSTDSEAIACHARANNALVPALRPADIAGDESPVVPALQHALEAYERSACVRVSAIVLLQPTSPFRTAADIDDALDRFEQTNADTLISVCPAKEHPYYAWRPSGQHIEPLFSRVEIQMVRQQLPGAYMENGAIYVTKRSNVVQSTLYGERVVAHMMDELHGLDIDTPLDLSWAEFLLQRGIVRLDART